MSIGSGEGLSLSLPRGELDGFMILCLVYGTVWFMERHEIRRRRRSFDWAGPLRRGPQWGGVFDSLIYRPSVYLSLLLRYGTDSQVFEIGRENKAGETI